MSAGIPLLFLNAVNGMKFCCKAATGESASLLSMKICVPATMLVVSEMVAIFVAAESNLTWEKLKVQANRNNTRVRKRLNM